MIGDRGVALKNVEKMPPEFRREGCSLVEYDLTTGDAAGTADSLTSLVRRSGLVAEYLLAGSRADALLDVVSWCCPFTMYGDTYLLSFGSSTRREEPDPDRGV